MKRKISICAAALTAVLLSAALWSYNRRDLPEEETQLLQAQSETEPVEELAAVNTDNAIRYLYVLRDCDGRVVVYLQESGELFMETGIRTADLPEDVQNRLSEGFGFQNEESLFDFLESYSS